MVGAGEWLLRENLLPLEVTSELAENGISEIAGTRRSPTFPCLKKKIMFTIFCSLSPSTEKVLRSSDLLLHTVPRGSGTAQCRAKPCLEMEVVCLCPQKFHQLVILQSCAEW